MTGHSVDLALLVLRVGVGVVFLAHGINHVFGGGKIAGTGRWFCWACSHRWRAPASSA